MSTIIGSDTEIKKSPSFIYSTLAGVLIILIAIFVYNFPSREFAEGFEILVYIHDGNNKVAVKRITTTENPDVVKSKLPCYEFKNKQFCNQDLSTTVRPTIVCVANC